MIVKPSETVRGLSSELPLPRGRYTCVCIEESFDLSKSSQNPMITRTWEIVAPEEVQINGKTVNVAGTKATQYMVTQVNPPQNATEEEKEECAKKTRNKMGQLYADYDKLGIPYSEDGIDAENPTLGANGLTADWVMDAERTVMRQAPTAEQAAKRQLGDPIRDANNKEIESYRPRLVMLLGRSTAQVGTPY